MIFYHQELDPIIDKILLNRNNVNYYDLLDFLQIELKNSSRQAVRRLVKKLIKCGSIVMNENGIITKIKDSKLMYANIGRKNYLDKKLFIDKK